MRRLPLKFYMKLWGFEKSKTIEDWQRDKSLISFDIFRKVNSIR